MCACEDMGQLHAHPWLLTSPPSRENLIAIMVSPSRAAAAELKTCHICQSVITATICQILTQDYVRKSSTVVEPVSCC